jgi:hypothetical protein
LVLLYLIYYIIRNTDFVNSDLSDQAETHKDGFLRYQPPQTAFIAALIGKGIGILMNYKN